MADAHAAIPSEADHSAEAAKPLMDHHAEITGAEEWLSADPKQKPSLATSSSSWTGALAATGSPWSWSTRPFVRSFSSSSTSTAGPTTGFRRLRTKRSCTSPATTGSGSPTRSTRSTALRHLVLLDLCGGDSLLFFIALLAKKGFDGYFDTGCISFLLRQVDGHSAGNDKPADGAIR